MRFCRWPHGLAVLTCIGIWVATQSAVTVGQRPLDDLPAESAEGPQLLEADIYPEPEPDLDAPRVLPEADDEPVPISSSDPVAPVDGQPNDSRQTIDQWLNDQPPADGSAVGAARLTIEAARFDGIQAGTSTIDDVTAAWGEPEKVEPLEDGRQRIEYSMDPFERIVVYAEDDRVASIVVFLAGQFPAEALAKQLKLADLAAVIITDDDGNWLGEAYPERGVVFHFKPQAKGRQVSQVILETVDAQAFVLRSEGLFESNLQAALADVDVAVELDPDLARAHWMRARVLAAIGRPGNAIVAAQTATRLDPQNAEFRFALAEVLQTTGDFAAASAQTNQGITLAGDRAELKAHGLLQLGNQIASGPDRDYRRATEYHLRAIKLAESVADDRRPRVRAVATEVLVEAYLAVANDIAWGHWRQKERAVPMWLGRAWAIVDGGIETDPGNRRFRLRVVRQALASHVGMGGSLDPTEWVQRLRQVAAEQAKAVNDDYGQNRLRWEIGVGLYDAMQTCHLRSEHDKALEYGGTAVSYLEAGSQRRDDLPADAYLKGRLYFRVGSIYAIQRADHTKAIAWFDKAVPLLKRSVPKSALSDIGRQGESLVSMAVSYWEETRHDDAIHLTDQGVKMMEQAVNDGILDRSKLVVPYGNLATMHQQLGNDQRARYYIELTGGTQPISR